MINDALRKALDNLIDEIMKTEEYKNYRESSEEVKDDNDALDRIERVRELSIRVQEMSEDEYNRESENVSTRMEELCENPKVSRYIQSEVEFSKVYQYITERIISIVDED